MEPRVYQISFAPRAERDFRSFAPEVQRRLRPRLDTLARNPRPRGVKTLEGEEGLLRLSLRLSIGDYRVLYRVEEHDLKVLVLKIGHRREVYRRP